MPSDRVFLATPEQLEAAFPMGGVKTGRNPFTGETVEAAAGREPSPQFAALPYHEAEEELGSFLLAEAPGTRFEVRPQHVVVELSTDWLSELGRPDIDVCIDALASRAAPGAGWFFFALEA